MALLNDTIFRSDFIMLDMLRFEMFVLTKPIEKIFLQRVPLTLLVVSHSGTYGRNENLVSYILYIRFDAPKQPLKIRQYIVRPWSGKRVRERE